MRSLHLLVISVMCGCGGGSAPAPGSQAGVLEGGAFTTTASSFEAEGPRPEVIVEAVFTNHDHDPVMLEPCGRVPYVRVQKQTSGGWTDAFPSVCQGPEVEIVVGPGRSERVERRMAMAPNEAVVPQPLTDEIGGTYRVGVVLPESVVWSNAFVVEHPPR